MAKVERGNPTENDKNVYRFYKSNLPAVIWNPDTNSSLAEFKKGVFKTEDKKIAQKLVDLGYPQISPQATQPPDIILGLPGQSIDTGENSNENIRPGAGENDRIKPITPVVIQG